MGVFDEYINGLEGKTELDPLTIAADLTRLHNEEISTREAKIESQTGAIAERDSSIKAKDLEIDRWKAENYDLTMQIPGRAQPTGNDSNNDNRIDGSTITPEDLFESI